MLKRTDAMARVAQHNDVNDFIYKRNIGMEEDEEAILLGIYLNSIGHVLYFLLQT